MAMHKEKGIETSHPVRGAWIEIGLCSAAVGLPLSHPVRGAWIEIKYGVFEADRSKVASRKGCVD